MIISHYKKLIAEMCRTIDVITENEYIIDEFSKCGVNNSKIFRQRY